MAGSNVSAVSNYFATANEGFATTLNGSISSGATTVPLTSVSGLTNGSIFVGIIEPGATNQQVFTGTVSTGGTSITGVQWTRGTNVAHTGGVAIVDYTTGTAFNMITTGILKQHTQGGAHTGLTTDTLSTSGNASVGGTLGVTGASTLGGAIGGAGYSMATMSNPYKFSVYLSTTGTSTTSSTVLKFNTKIYDTGTNYSTSTGLFTAPINGFYFFDSSYLTSSGSNAALGMQMFQNATQVAENSGLLVTSIQGNQSLSVCRFVQMVAGDTLSVEVNNGTGNLTIDPGATATWFEGFLVSKT